MKALAAPRLHLPPRLQRLSCRTTQDPLADAQQPEVLETRASVEFVIRDTTPAQQLIIYFFNCMNFTAVTSVPPTVATRCIMSHTNRACLLSARVSVRSISILWSDRQLFLPNPLSERENSVRNSTAMEEPEVQYQRHIGPECGVQW